jgi:hypothetical protein
MSQQMQIRLAHLYPDLLNIYADRGNILCLQRQCEWRGIDFIVDGFGAGQTPAWSDYDLIYLGGGQDRDQKLIFEDLLEKGKGLAEAVEAGGLLLGVCGGYQLLGRYYRTAAGETMEGVGLFDAHTEAGNRRLIGNVVIESEMDGQTIEIVGFENHSGKTYLAEGQQPFGRVTTGFGNNSEDGMEGIVYKNAIGTYLHGPLLPKNPALTDFLLQKCMQLRYGADARLAPLDHRLEHAAHEVAVRISRGR